MNYRDIIVFDLETGSANPQKAQITQIAAVALHPRKLKIQTGGIFNSEVRPILDDELAIKEGLDPVQEEALQITGKNRKDLAKAPSEKIVWKSFVDFCNKFNFKKTSYFAPIAAGYNINGFDLPIINRVAEKYGDVGKNGKQKIFNNIFSIDMMQHLYCWFEDNQDVKSFKMDYFRDYFGFPEESKANAHDALQDVKDTANILIKFLKFQREICGKTKFQKAFASGEFYV